MTTDPALSAVPDLDDFLDGPEPDWDTEPEAPPNAAEADTLLWRLGRVRAAAERDTEAAGERIIQVNNWLASRMAVHKRQEAWLLDALRRYHIAVLTRDPKRFTINLPSGSLTSRMGHDWTVEDTEFLAAFVPEPLAAATQARWNSYRKEVTDLVVGTLGERADLVKVDDRGNIVPSKSGIQKWATRRDEKNRPVEWGVDPEGNPIPGVSCVSERQYDVRFPDLLSEAVDGDDLGDDAA